MYDVLWVFLLQDWLCKTLTALSQYFMLANIMWMFVEGLFLHNRVAIAVFSTDAPFKLFYFIGWGKDYHFSEYLYLRCVLKLNM